MSRLSYFYIAAGIATAIFALGVAANLAFWLTGARGPRPLGRGLRLALSGVGLQTFLSRGLGQIQLWQESKLRWTMSMALTWGSIELFFIGSVGNLLREYGIYSLSKDSPLFALMNELGGALLLLGLALAAYRRLVLREAQLRGGWEDGLVLAWLGAVAVSGYLAEAARLLAQGVPPSPAAYSFLGYPLARAMGAGWGGAEPYLWWLHAASALALLAYIPYSKLFHLLSAPLSMMVKAGEARHGVG